MSAFLLAATLAASPAAAVVTPTARWTVDFAEDRCLATRDFKAGERRFTLGFALPILDRDSALFYLSVPLADGAKWRGARIIVPGAPAPTDDLGDGPAESAGMHIFIRRLPSGAQTALPAAARVELAAPDLAATIAIDAMARLKPILDTCERDLLVTRGMPKEAAETTAVFPQPLQTIVSYFKDTDYPDSAIRNEEQGDVQTLLTIAADGRVTACKVTKGSGSALLDTTTCDVITRRARFEPARDQAGQPIEGFTQARIKWRLPVW